MFILDGRGVVRAMTPAAEALVSGGTPLGLRGGRLHAARPDETGRLAEAIRLAVASGGRFSAPQLRTLLVSGPVGLPLVLDVVPLPRRLHGFGHDPRALLVVRGAERNPARARLLLQAAFRLTATGAEVALLLATGLPPEAIAATRSVALGTIRTQIKAIYAKLGVHRQSELVAYVNHLR
ncbi:MAG: helix-turn-helix transcriptional regulator [Xanthomonadaceae bacterium]|nr:helix-turn-helix transcriptional regulator [Xanthomonadaceae bacterium]